MIKENSYKRRYSTKTKVGVWSSLVSSTLLIAIGIFWLLAPGAAESSFNLSADTPSANDFARLVAIFKAVGDILPAVFVVIALLAHQFRMVGYFHIVTLLLVIVVDIITWQAFVPNASLRHAIMHLPFALPMAVATYCFLASKKDAEEERGI